MKNRVIIFLLILGTSFSWSQDFKIVGGNEISLNTQNGGGENFIEALKKILQKEILKLPQRNAINWK